MEWLIAAPFIQSSDNRWLGRFVPGQRHSFSAVPSGYRHDRSRSSTAIGQWADYLQHGHRVMARAGRTGRTGAVTLFPQLAATVGLCKRLTGSCAPVVAWAFNVGTLPGGGRRAISRFALDGIDRFIVHSTAEVGACSSWLDYPRERFRFVPLQRAVLPVTVPEDGAEPFVVALGSAHRDYRLLCSVLRELAYRAVIVAGAHAVDGISLPANVEVRTGLTIEQCHELLQRARLNVIPIRNAATASGQVSLLDSMMLGRPTIVTECPGSVDYVSDREDALLVKPGDHEGLKAAVSELWADEALRARLGQAARLRAVRDFSDEAIGVRLGEVLTDVERQLTA